MDVSLESDDHFFHFCQSHAGLKPIFHQNPILGRLGLSLPCSPNAAIDAHIDPRGSGSRAPAMVFSLLSVAPWFWTTFREGQRAYFLEIFQKPLFLSVERHFDPQSSFLEIIEFPSIGPSQVCEIAVGLPLPPISPRRELNFGPKSQF